MKNLFENITNEQLDSLDMSLSSLISNGEYKNYYESKSSLEHYRFLTYVSNLYNKIKIIDVGTLKGCSALALSSNKSNTVYSFNISNQLELDDLPGNIEFIIDNVINEKYIDLINSSEIILLDTFHDGTFESQFLQHLININFKGILILDDIKLNQNMIDFWNNIKLDKLDVTTLGHSTGTGIVFFI